MSKRKSQSRLKLRLFLPIATIIIISTTIVTILFVNSSIKTFNTQLENSLVLEVETITKMFERERELKLENVKKNLDVAHNMFYGREFYFTNEQTKAIVKNQISSQTHEEFIFNCYLDGELLNESSVFVDSITNLLGGTATIFQKIDSGYVRITTNVLDFDGNRAVNTYIPNSSPVIEAIEQGERYYGRAFVVNDWYITAYEPIYVNDKIVGILYVGNYEKDLDKLRSVLNNIKIGKTGYPFVFDKLGKLIIHPKIEGQNWADSTLFQDIVYSSDTIFRYDYQGMEKVAVVNYYEDFELFIAATLEINTESETFIRNTIIRSVLVGLITIIILLVILFFLTADRIYKYLQQLDLSKRRLKSTAEELEQSQDRFQKLFNSVGDSIFVTDMDENIIEINQASCNNLGYSKEEFLKMKITGIKSSEFAVHVGINRKKIIENGFLIYESEHLTKDGRKILVEIISRLIDYNNEKLVLSIARNITIRKETEKEILSTVIRTEERERARFAKDMHDSVGPLLSTIKLYVNELNSSAIDADERNEFVGEVNSIIDESIRTIREISNNLMPLTISKYGLINALESFINKVNKTDKINIIFKKVNFEQRLDPNTELILFRVITELINNTLKHANAQNINIDLEKSIDKVNMHFKDDGVGFDIEQIMELEHKGMGLRNIISRIKSISGSFLLDSAVGEGFKIDVSIEL